MAGHFPSFRIEDGPDWPRIRIALSGTSVRGPIVMLEEVTGEAGNVPQISTGAR